MPNQIMHNGHVYTGRGTVTTFVSRGEEHFRRESDGFRYVEKLPSPVSRRELRRYYRRRGIRWMR